MVAGLAATFISPRLTRRLGLIRCGLWSIWSQVFCLLPVALAFYINGGSGTVPTILLFVGMALSRIGLWSFDLAETQIIQEGSPNEEAGLISGFQYSLCNVFGTSLILLRQRIFNTDYKHFGCFISFRYARIRHHHHMVVSRFILYPCNNLLYNGSPSSNCLHSLR